jgi:hypothetical protein
MKGCSGGCGKDHPRVVLDFAPLVGTTTESTEVCSAVLSHPLDPFLQHFQELCKQGLAREKYEKPSGSWGFSIVGDVPAKQTSSSRTYYLTGFLQGHVEKLKQSSRFGFHLVKVSPAALAASKRAHERQLEQEEELTRHAKKRRRTQVVGVDKNGDGFCMLKQDDNAPLFEQALQICYDNRSLADHLDVAEISWMRLCGNRTMAKIASQLAAIRLEQVCLAFSVLVKGKISSQSFARPGDENDSEGRIWIHREEYFPFFEQYMVIGSRLPLTPSPDNISMFIPEEQNQQFQWENENEEDDSPHFRALIRVYLEGTNPLTANQEPPEKDCLFKKRLEIARFRIDPEGHGLREGTHKSACGKFTYEVSPAGINAKGGCFTLKSFEFGFHDLLGIYVRKKLPLAKQNMQDIKRERPITRVEREYVKAIAKAAREAPGGGERAFRGMLGWRAI